MAQYKLFTSSGYLITLDKISSLEVIKDIFNKGASKVIAFEDTSGNRFERYGDSGWEVFNPCLDATDAVYERVRVARFIESKELKEPFIYDTTAQHKEALMQAIERLTVIQNQSKTNSALHAYADIAQPTLLSVLNYMD